MTQKQNEKREAAFKDWLEDECEVPLPLEPADREIAELSLREAFHAGWDAQKSAVEYKIN